MCDHSGRLMAWLDRELGNDEMVEFERHIGACSECRSRLESYKQASATFDAYCDAVLSAKTRQKRLPRWVPMLTTAAAAAITATLCWCCCAHASSRPRFLPRCRYRCRHPRRLWFLKTSRRRLQPPARRCIGRGPPPPVRRAKRRTGSPLSAPSRFPFPRNPCFRPGLFRRVLTSLRI